MIGIIIADELETNFFSLKIDEAKNINGFTFIICKIGIKKIVVVNSGIGLVNAAAATQSLIDNFKITKIYNCGAVGSDESHEVYDIVIPEKIFFHDVITPWYPRGQVPREKRFYINALKGKDTGLASGMTFLNNKSQVLEVQKHLNVSTFDMECAAILSIAWKTKTPVAVVKCVSDQIGVDNSSLENINTRIKTAGQIVFKKVIDLITNKHIK